MKKRWMILLAVVLVLAACSETGTDKNEPKDVSEKTNKTEEKSNDQDKSESLDEEAEDDTAEAEEEKEQETTIEKEEPEAAESDEEADNSNSSKETNTKEQEKKQDKDEESQKGDKDQEDEVDEDATDEDIVEFAFHIFDAQVEEDYAYLESVLSKGSSVNKKNNTIQFDDVTYPHEYEFLSKKDREFLDERYIQEEKDGSVIVGFEVTDYANETSYIIDVQFIKEDGKWKLNDIDINK